MAISNGYVTLEAFRSAIDIVDASYTSDDADIDRAIEAASREIDNYCGRFFYQDDSATRYYTPDFYDRLFIDDLRAITTLKEDTTGDGTYNRLWAEDTDFVLGPYNSGSRPYWWVETGRLGSYEFPRGVPKAIQIVGNFGWDAVPTDVAQACLIEANRLLWRRTAPAGVAGFSEFGVARLYSRLDPDAQKLLDPFRKLGPVV